MHSDKYSIFILNALLLLSIIVFADQVIGRTLRYLYFKQQSGLYYRTTYAIDSTKAKMLVFGSSRANHHYVPDIFEDSLNLSFYNTGRDGNFILFNYAVFKSVINRYTPDIVIFDINNNELCKDETSYERLSALLPYYRNHKEIHDVVELRSSFEKYKLLSEIYPFNSSLATIILGNLELNKTRKLDNNGYVSLHNIIGDTVLYEIHSMAEVLDQNKINAVTEIIELCNIRNIQLVFIQSPLYAIVNNSASIDYFEILDKKNKVVFWNFSKTPELLKTPSFFQDQHHLNNDGAIWFSNLLVQKIKNKVQEDS